VSKNNPTPDSDSSDSEEKKEDDRFGHLEEGGDDLE
jgi:hypothetical protein